MEYGETYTPLVMCTCTALAYCGQVSVDLTTLIHACLRVACMHAASGMLHASWCLGGACVVLA